jgi:cytochrome P450
MGNGIFNRDGEIWKAHRALTRPFFARERLIDFEIFEKFSQKTLDVLSNHPEGVPIDIQDLFARFTMDTGVTFVSSLEISPYVVY